MGCFVGLMQIGGDGDVLKVSVGDLGPSGGGGASGE